MQLPLTNLSLVYSFGLLFSPFYACTLLGFLLCLATPLLLPLTGPPPSFLPCSPPPLLLTGARVRALRAGESVRVITRGHGGVLILRVTVIMSAVVRVATFAFLLVRVPVYFGENQSLCRVSIMARGSTLARAKRSDYLPIISWRIQF